MQNWLCTWGVVAVLIMEGVNVTTLLFILSLYTVQLVPSRPSDSPPDERLKSCTPTVMLHVYKRATTPQLQSQFCPNESHCRLGTRSPIVRGDWGRVAWWRWERSSWQGWCQKDEIKTQYKLNSRPKGEPRKVGLSVDAFPFAWLVSCISAIASNLYFIYASIISP